MQSNQKPRRIRFKCRFDGDTRTVTVTPETEFSELRKRLSTDYGFEVSMKYEDKDGDMIILASQNDLDDIFMHDEAETINVMISEMLSLPNLHLKGSMSSSRLGTASNANVVSLYNTSSVMNSAVLSNPTGLLSSAREWSKPQNTSISDVSSTSSFTVPAHSNSSTNTNNTNSSNNTLSHSFNHSSSRTQSILRPVPTTSTTTHHRFPNINEPHHAHHKSEIFNIRWKKGEMLGQGAFGVVYLGLNIDSGELMAVKMMATDDVSKRELAALENEIKLLRSLRHPNIVRYIGTELNPECMSIFLEYVPGGSLKALIDKFGSLEESVAKSYTRQLLIGLEYLHRHGIAHRDIKGANCLVGNDGVIKLADFGNSKHWRPAVGTGTNGSASISGSCVRDGSNGGGVNGAAPSGDIKGTPSWMAPEVIRDEGGSISWRKADIWSLACTTLEMTTGKAPWKQFNNPVTILYHIACMDTLPEYPSPASFELITFLNTCLQRDPKLRPDITSLLLHPFVAHMILPSSISNNNYTTSTSTGYSSSVYGNRPSTVSHAVVGEWDRAPSMFYNGSMDSSSSASNVVNSGAGNNITSICSNIHTTSERVNTTNVDIPSVDSGINSPFPAEDPELALEVDHTTHMSTIHTPRHTLHSVPSDYVDTTSTTPVATHHTTHHTLHTTLDAEPIDAGYNATNTTPIPYGTTPIPNTSAQSTPTTTYTKSMYPNRLAALTHTTSSPSSARSHKRRTHKNNVNTSASSTANNASGVSSPSSRVGSAVKGIHNTTSSGKRNKKNTASPTHIQHTYTRDLDSPVTIPHMHSVHEPYSMHNIHGEVVDSTSAVGAMEAQLARLLHDNAPKGAQISENAPLGTDSEAPTPIKNHSTHTAEDNIITPPTTLRIPKLDIHSTIHHMAMSGEKADVQYNPTCTATANYDTNANTNTTDTTTPTRKVKSKKHRTKRTTFDSFDSDDNWHNDAKSTGGSFAVGGAVDTVNSSVSKGIDVVDGVLGSDMYIMDSVATNGADTNRSMISIVLDTNRSISSVIVDPYEYNNDSSVCIEGDSMYDDTSIGYSSADEPRVVSSEASNTSSIRGNVHHTVHSISYGDGSGVAMSPNNNTINANATSTNTTHFTAAPSNTTTANTRGVMRSGKIMTGPNAHKKLNLSRSQTELEDLPVVSHNNNIHNTTSCGATGANTTSSKGTSVIKPTALQTPSSGVRRRDISTANTTQPTTNNTSMTTNSALGVSDSLDESNMLEGLFTYSTLSTTNTTHAMRNSNSRRSLDATNSSTNSSRMGTRNSTTRTSNRHNATNINNSTTITNHNTNATNTSLEVDPLDISCDSLDKLTITGTGAANTRTHTTNSTNTNNPATGSDVREGTAKGSTNSTRQSRRVSTAKTNSHTTNAINPDAATNTSTTHTRSSMKRVPDDAYLTRSLSASFDHDDTEYANDTAYPTHSGYTSMFNTPPTLLHEHTAAITRLRAPARTTLLLSSSLDGTVRVWDSSSNNTSGDSVSSKLVLEATGFKCDNVYGDRVERRIVMGGSTTTNNTNNTIDSDVYTTNTARTPTIRINNLWSDEYCDFIYAACSDACIRVWSGEGKSVRLLRGHEDSISVMEGIDSGTSSGSGSSMIATGSVDRTVRVWDARAKKAQVFAFRGHGDTVLALRWGEGGRSLVSSGKDKTVRIWDTRAGRLRATLEKHFGAVSCIRVLNNNNTNTTSTTSNTNANANAYGSSIGSITGTSTNASGIDSTCIVSAGRDSMMNVWSSSGDCIHSQTAHRSNVSFLSEINYTTSSGGVVNNALSSSIGNMGGYSSTYNATLASQSYGYTNTRAVYSAPFCTNPLLISIGTDSVIKLWDMRRFKCVSEINPHASGNQCGLFTKAVWCNEGFIVSSNTGVVRLYEYGNGDSGSISGKDNAHSVYHGYDMEGVGRSGSHSPGALPYPTSNVYNAPGTATTVSEWTYRDIGVHTNSSTSTSMKDNTNPNNNTTTTASSMNASTDLICTENICASASKSGQILRWTRQ